MPLYGTPQAGSNWANPGLNIASVVAGDLPFYFLNNEMLLAGQSSIAVAYDVIPFITQNPTFYVSWAVPPTAFSLSIQASNTTDTNAAYSAAGGSITSSPAFVYSATAYPGRMYYRVNMFSITLGPGSGLTVFMKP